MRLALALLFFAALQCPTQASSSSLPLASSPRPPGPPITFAHLSAGTLAPSDALYLASRASSTPHLAPYLLSMQRVLQRAQQRALPANPHLVTSYVASARRRAQPHLLLVPIPAPQRTLDGQLVLPVQRLGAREVLALRGVRVVPRGVGGGRVGTETYTLELGVHVLGRGEELVRGVGVWGVVGLEEAMGVVFWEGGGRGGWFEGVRARLEGCEGWRPLDLSEV
ncbi:MAG: hypothetical protein M1829_000320 [Trizodia sp. TS-e1964]|nr:MAG: hypothetical protein M1829_000320 [Trizodia sp. TS-e1964]